MTLDEKTLNEVVDGIIHYVVDAIEHSPDDMIGADIESCVEHIEDETQWQHAYEAVSEQIVKRLKEKYGSKH